MNRILKFRAWNKHKNIMIKVVSLDWARNAIGTDLDYIIAEGNRNTKFPMYPMSDWILMQFTGLHDNSKELKEIYEGDIIDVEGKLKGNIYESPQIHQERTNHIITSMGTDTWRGSESIAMGRGCRYTEQ